MSNSPAFDFIKGILNVVFKQKGMVQDNLPDRFVNVLGFPIDDNKIEEISDDIQKQLIKHHQWVNEPAFKTLRDGVSKLLVVPFTLDKQLHIAAIDFHVMSDDPEMLAITASVSTVREFIPYLLDYVLDPDYHESTGGDPHHMVAQIEAQKDQIIDEMVRRVDAHLSGLEHGRSILELMGEWVVDISNAAIKTFYPE